MTHSSTPVLTALLDQIVEQRNQRVAAFEREALLADVLGMQVALETFGGRELPQDVLALVDRDLALQAAEQELVLQPQALFGIRDMRELRADGAAVDVFELRDDVAQLQARREFAGTRAGEEFGVEIGVGESEVARAPARAAADAAACRADRAWR